ncbi:MAG: YkgJ family cysteine cluster protein [Myxococcaceae bacterium]|nr:YkgJ family cysteine cluster protein [Myxococcaceae bacterium]
MLSELCQQCGLCCSGALFTFLPVTEEEAKRVVPLGVRTEQRRDGRLALLLPCAVLRSTRCGAYDARPARCREYVCELGKAVQRRERPLDAALAVVDEAKRGLAELEALLGPPEPGDVRSTLQRAQQAEAREPDDVWFKAVRGKARSLEAMLQQYFVGSY